MTEIIKDSILIPTVEAVSDMQAKINVLQQENDLLRKELFNATRCECSEDEACRFMRERDQLRSLARQLMHLILIYKPALLKELEDEVADD